MIDKINLVYFSATGTTRKIVYAIESGIGAKKQKVYDLWDQSDRIITFPGHEVVIFGVPVFSGRVPELAKVALGRIKGHNTPAIIACVYGNRDFDDALLELKDIVQSNGFRVVSAGAFVAQHSIFPNIGHGRPDEADIILAKELGAKSISIIDSGISDRELHVEGNKPYGPINHIPLSPKTTRKCNGCMACAKSCPAHAIDSQNPKKTDRSKCISCAHCVAICPMHAKRFGGMLYWLASRKFEKHCSQRKEPYVIYR